MVVDRIVDWTENLCSYCRMFNQSKYLINMDRIELYNQCNNEHIVQNVTDLKDPDGNACGTRFELYIPYHYNYF